MFSANNNVFKHIVLHLKLAKENPDEKDTELMSITCRWVTYFQRFCRFCYRTYKIIILEIVRWSSSTAYHLLILKFHS